MNKNTIIKIILAIIIIITFGILLYIVSNNNTDEIKFKKEYESLNGKENDSGKKYLNISIPKDNNVKYLKVKEVLEFLDNGTGILYFGFPECPWCRNAVPVLLDSAKENEIENIYYYNALSIRDEKVLKNGKIVTKKKGTKNYYKIVDKLKDYLGAYEGLEDESIKRLYFPTVVFVRGGKIVGVHSATVDSQTNPYKKLNAKQTKELKKIYTNYINKIYGTCDDSC